MNEQSNNVLLHEAAMKQMMDYDAILTNERGDELWRWSNSDDGRAQWKVWAVSEEHRRTISSWNETREGASYYKAGQFVGCDYIIPKKYLLSVVQLLDLRFSEIAEVAL